MPRIKGFHYGMGRKSALNKGGKTFTGKSGKIYPVRKVKKR